MTALWHWLVHLMGVDQGQSYGRWNWYNFHSGFAGSVFLGSLLNGIAVFFLFYIHHTCGGRRMCLRWGRYAAAGGTYRLCWKHHPDMGARPDRETIRRHHHEWKQAAR